MQQSMKNKNVWNWHASGKHPIFKDFFKMGSEDPMLMAFADWAGGGFQQLVSGQGAAAVRGDYSWRFWSRSPKKGVLISGVGRDSSDSLGRPHPLVIVGSGPLEGWESNWDLLPFALDDIWSQFEYLACGRVKEFRQLEQGFSRIKQPSSDWLALAHQRTLAGTLNTSVYIAKDPQVIVNQVQQVLDTGTTVIPLYTEVNADSFLLAGYWSFALKAHLKNVPNAVFMGGIPEKSYLVLINRSLTTEDFLGLWNMASQ
jgi:type VI secretion system protein VasJ